MQDPDDRAGARPEAAGSRSARVPDVVVVGALARDVDPVERRGWRPGGAVSFVSLTLARLGLQVGAVVGLDPVALGDREPVALRSAGVDLVRVSLERGPVFVNRELPGGRQQLCVSRSDMIPVDSVPDDWRSAPAFVFAPVAAELDDGWADVPAADALVALGWQGLLRDLEDGRPTRRRPPTGNPLGLRADLGAASRDDVAGAPADALERLVARPGQLFALTAGRSGGLLLDRNGDGTLNERRWDCVPARHEVDVVGAGDVFLAAAFAALLVSRHVTGGWPPGQADSVVTAALRFAAVAASISVEGVGLSGVPDVAAIRRRISEMRGPQGRWP